MKVLIIHHLEPAWEDGYNKANTSFEELCHKFAEYLEENSYDYVILTRFEDYEIKELEYYIISDYVTNIETYAYGWDKSCIDSELDIDKELNTNGFVIDNYNQIWCNGGNHSEVLIIDKWMMDLPKTNVDISGAFAGECLEDLEIALNFLKIDYNRIENLIIGI